MSVKLRSGFYLGKKSCVTLALLLAALLLALLVLAILYGRCAQELKASGLQPAASSTPCSDAGGEPATRPPGPWDDQRLPVHLAPVHYSLLLWPHLAPGLPEPRTHSGQVNITVLCREATSTVLLHSVDLTYRGASVWGPLDDYTLANGTRSIPLAELWQATANQYVVLELLENLSAGAFYEVRLAFQGKIQSEPDFFGLFSASYEDEGESRWMIASQLQPIAARCVYPCFDEPAMKATFNISIVHHPSYVALSNMQALDASEYKDVNESTLNALINETAPINWTVTTFEKSLKMSTYITAFVVCRFSPVITTERGNQIRIWARKDAVQKGFTSYALNITGPIFSFLEDLFNISYPLSKTDLVALPYLHVGGMENWGLMIFQEEYLLYNPEYKFKQRKIEICRIVAHEIAHQWFGNLVTMNWWNDLWLNEGFASYLEYQGIYYIEHIMPLNKLFSNQVVLPMLAMDSEMQNQSLSDTDENRQTETLIELFSSVTYRKGASIIWMLSNFMTERLFIKALSSYLNAFSFSSAIQDDLWNHIQKAIDEENHFQLPAPVKVIMDSWTCQNGFPLLTVDFSTGSISQEQFFDGKRKDNSTKTWIIPISWIRNGTLQPIVWLDKTSKIFPEMKISVSEQDWIILNMNMSAYCRINYDQKYWRRLARVLENDPKVIPSISRLQLMADAFELSRSNYTDFDTPLYLTKYLEEEEDITVWDMVLENLNIHNWDFILSDSELYPVLKKYFLPRITPIYHRYAHLLRENTEVLEINPYIVHAVERILRTVCWFGLRDCLDLASEFFNKWMDNSKHEIPVCFSPTICCYGVRMGNDKEWDFLWETFKQNETTDIVKSNIFSALSCTRVPWLLQRFLQYVLNNYMDSSIVTEVVKNVAKNEVGHWIAWRFVSENWSKLPTSDTLDALMNTVTTDMEAQMVQIFLNNTLEPEQRKMATDTLLKTKNEYEKRKESVTKMIIWLKKNMDD